MGKRSNGEGSITQRKDGLYMARYTVEVPTGEKKRKTLYAKTRKKAAEQLTKAMADRDSGLVFDAENQSVGEFLERWVNASVRDTVRQRTFERHEELIRLHIKPALGKLKLTSYTCSHSELLQRQIG